MGVRIGSRIGWVFVVAVLAATSVAAQERPSAQRPDQDPDTAVTNLPPIIVRVPRAPTPCGDRTGQARLECLNAVLSEAAGTATPPRIDVPSIHSAPTALGLANDAATRQRLGTNYGISPFPQARPTPTPPSSPFVRSPPR